MNLNPDHGTESYQNNLRVGFSTTDVSSSSFILPWSRKGRSQGLSQIELLCLEKGTLKTQEKVEIKTDKASLLHLPPMEFEATL